MKGNLPELKWVELTVPADKQSVDRIKTILDKYGHGGAMIEGSQSFESPEQACQIKAYLLHNQSYQTTKRRIEDQLKQLGGTPRVLVERFLQPSDWLDSLKDHFSPLEIGEWLVITPSWNPKSEAASGRISIVLDPGVAFGTGLHPTTRLCLIALKKYLQPEMSVLDLGTGTGIISVAAEKLGAAYILALDIDPVAVKAAQSNVSVNCLTRRVQVKKGSLGLRTQNQYRNFFDLVLANITAAAISGLASAFSRVLRPGGRLIVSGIHSEGLDMVLISLALSGFKLEAIQTEDQWYAVIALKD